MYDDSESEIETERKKTRESSKSWKKGRVARIVGVVGVEKTSGEN